jgi:glycosyltransferase involved in cell wall biosynthesis
MRIGIDARELCGHPTGVGRYLSGLLTQWARPDAAARHQFVLYAHETPTTSFGADGGPSGSSAARFSTRVIPGSGGTRWEQLTLAAAVRRDRLDLFFAPGYTAPLRLPVPLVVAIHDVSFAARPEWFTTREGWRRRFLSRRAAAKAAAVITISRFSRSELVKHLGADPARIHVIPPGIDEIGRLADDNQQQQQPTPTASLLYVGSIFNRRHLPDLIRAFALVARAHPEATLDLVGDNRTYPPLNIEEIIERECRSGQVQWRRYVTESELRRLYRHARAFAFLSEYEGLGLTPLEALAAGIPSVLLDTPVARESCGAAALYVRQGDLEGIARAIERLLFDPPTRSALLAAAPTVLARYNWPEAGRQTLAVLERAATTP